MACLHYGEGTHVCRPDGVWERVVRLRRRSFWCFKCRQHLLHTLMAFRQTAPSHHDDFYKWECPQCHEDHTEFPS